VIYTFIQAHPEHAVARWAPFFEVSASGYYAWRQERESRQAREDKYAVQVQRIFDQSGGTYGADRVAAQLRKEGFSASFKKVKRIMNEQGLFSVHLRYRRSLTDSRGARDEDCQNLLQAQFAIRPFEVLSSDITYLPTEEGFVYTCTVRDICSGIVLSAQTASHMKKELVMDTIRSAAKSWKIAKGTVFHSDRGSQYTSAAVRDLLRKLGFRQSFSRTGKPGDNTWSESFYSILKKELVHPIGRFQSREEAAQGVFTFINGFYNTTRIQKRLDYLSPLKWLNRYYSMNLRTSA
jgi:putative transposase